MLYLTSLSYIDFEPEVHFKTKHNSYLNEHAFTYCMTYRLTHILYIMLFYFYFFFLEKLVSITILQFAICTYRNLVNLGYILRTEDIFEGKMTMCQ